MADTIRMLVATDNHVGYNERDPVRGDDSWKTFHEIMCLAKDRDVDMVLLGGDLFHDNVPSRKSLYNVMRSLRLNCYGDKPCEIELLSDSTEHFDPSIGHANYEDQNINVAIPVFSIHGNHDDPSGEGHFAALDILEMAGLINYFGRVPQSDKITVKPLLLQKGSTKIALYGLSNVRDERLYRTFRHGDVEFKRPIVQLEDWYNIAVVHQNHHAHTATSYLPENFLSSFLDLVIWGHEHECDIEPRTNAEMGFKVMQPGSSVATSLAPGEALQKKVAILTITGREMKSESIPLKTVRPFVYKDIVLGQQKAVVKMYERHNHRSELTRWLEEQVEELIAEANRQWQEAQEADPGYEPSSSADEQPLPLVRLRVEYSAPDGGKFEVENPQRFSNRFTRRVANSHDVIQFHIKKRNAAASRLKASEELKAMMARAETAENVKVAKLVQEFLAAQSLTILPQNCFGDAVNQYIDKDDKHAMDLFINDSLVKQIKHLVSMNEDQEDEEEEDMIAQFDEYRAQLEEMFNKGQLKNRPGGKVRYKPKPPNWNDDLDGPWEDQPGAMIVEEQNSDDDMFNNDDEAPKPAASTRGRGRGRGARGGATSTRGTGSSTAKKATTARSTATRGRGKKKAVSESEEEEQDVIMLDDDEDQDEDVASVNGPNDSDSQAMFFAEPKKATKGKKTASTSTSARGSRAGSVASSAAKPSARLTATRKTPARAAATAAKTKQSQLPFTNSQASVFGGRSQRNVSDIEDDDDDDAFEPASNVGKRKR